MSSKPFESDLVLEEKISEATLRAYNVGFEQNKFRLQPLVDVLADVVPEFALGYHSGKSIPLTKLRKKLKEAAHRVYTTENYKKRGEFGELVLHLLLRDFCESIPLISKIWFKDTDNAPVHGFDGVHIVVSGGSKKLWLGESKLYKDGRAGVTDLASDLKQHIERDYLRREFNLIETKLPDTTPEIEYWRQLLHEHRRLEEVMDNICIPLVCTYSSSLYGSHNDNTEQFVEDFIAECRKLNEVFHKKKIKTNIDVLLMLLPVPSKDDLVSELDKRLKSMQAI